jgi:hypothetical protein
VILIPVAAAGDPSWTDIMTAFGTVGAVVVAVGIALWAEWRLGRRLKEEQERSNRLLKEERENSRAQIEEERRLAREREQLTEAYAVLIISARSWPKETDASHDPDDPLMCPMAIMVNHGHYAITGIDARFIDGGKIYRLVSTQHLSAFLRLPAKLRGKLPAGLQWASDEVVPWPENLDVVTLAPQDPGLRLFGPALRTTELLLAYPLVRWTDRWGTRWEYRRGEVRQVRGDEEWAL